MEDANCRVSSKKDAAIGLKPTTYKSIVLGHKAVQKTRAHVNEVTGLWPYKLWHFCHYYKMLCTCYLM
ncbi:unnamed protein product [Staurois parvus]|uniref:Uncharacterized protein n=1 Tax=Staurois parvus TaxID=386267 RepID=A0ABN9FKW4_9NEOB|nr:unnamed protein product [Staurois parvus]